MLGILSAVVLVSGALYVGLVVYRNRNWPEQ